MFYHFYKYFGELTSQPAMVAATKIKYDIKVKQVLKHLKHQAKDEKKLTLE